MARSLGTHPAIITMPSPIMYDGSEEPFKTMEDAHKELEGLCEIINHNYMNAHKALRGAQGVVDNSVDKDGFPKVQLKKENIEHESIRPEVMDWGRRSFITELAFRHRNVGADLQWARFGQPGVVSNIYFGPYDEGMALIAAGTYVGLPPAAPRYFYLDLKYSGPVHAKTAAGVPPTLTLQNTTQMYESIMDGRICMCMAYQAAANTAWEYSLYGGGVHLMR